MKLNKKAQNILDQIKSLNLRGRVYTKETEEKIFVKADLYDDRKTYILSWTKKDSKACLNGSYKKKVVLLTEVFEDAFLVANNIQSAKNILKRRGHNNLMPNIIIKRVNGQKKIFITLKNTLTGYELAIEHSEGRNGLAELLELTEKILAA